MSHDYGSKSGKERVREYKAMEAILRGETPEKRIMVGYKGEKAVPEESRLTEIMQKVRMPWFCPSCKKIMKKNIDSQVWRQFEHCFDCQIEFENKLRVKGEFDTYAKEIINGNKKAFLKDMKQSLDEFEETGGKVEWLNSVGVQDVELEKEKWEMGESEFAKVVDEAKEHITKLEKAIEDESKELDTTRESSN